MNHINAGAFYGRFLIDQSDGEIYYEVNFCQADDIRIGNDSLLYIVGKGIEQIGRFGKGFVRLAARRSYADLEFAMAIQDMDLIEGKTFNFRIGSDGSIEAAG